MKFDLAVKAIQAGDADGLRETLQARPDLATTRSPDGISLLMIAAYHRQPDLVAIIRRHLKVLDAVEATAIGELDQLRERLNATPAALAGWSADGFNLPQLAAFFGQAEILADLVARGSDLNLVSKNALRVHAINAAAASGSQACIEILLLSGVDADAAQHAGITALMSAAHRGDADMCELLLQHGAQKSLRDDSGKTAALYAREAGFDELAALLDD